MKLFPSYLKSCVYPKKVFDDKFTILPGEQLEKVIHLSCLVEGVDSDRLERKLYQSCRKLCQLV